MKAKIYNNTSQNSVKIYASFLINGTEIVFNRVSECIKIRYATIMDNKTYKISGNQFSIGFEGAKDLIGEYDVVKEGDYFELIKK